MQHTGADDLIKILIQFANALDRQTMELQVGDAMLSSEVSGYGTGWLR